LGVAPNGLVNSDVVFDEKPLGEPSLIYRSAY